MTPLERRIQSLATLSVMRGLGFACLGILMAMAGLAFAPALSFRLGAVCMLGIAALLQVKALSYPAIKRIRDSEVWIMLGDDERPSEAVARPLIVAAMVAELQQKALWAAGVASLFLCGSVLFGMSA